MSRQYRSKVEPNSVRFGMSGAASEPGLTKSHQPTPVGRPIISGCSGPTEQISAFVDHLIQPTAQLQASYLKDTTDFINFIERIKLLKVPYMFQWTSQYKKKPQREGITTVCLAYEEFHQGNPPVPTRFLSEMLSLILLENSFQFNEKDYLQTHGTAMGTKMAVAFANIFMAKIEKEILRQSSIKPIFWKRFIDDVISVWDTSRNEIEEFLLKANNFHPTIKFTAEISETETTFLDKGSTRILSLTCEHTSSVQRHSNTRISVRVTHQASQKASSKEKL